MRVDSMAYISAAPEAGETARAAEAAGYDGWWASETKTDPFVAATLAASATADIEIGTAIVVAFARNPMTVALQANDLQTLSRGRFILGMGSQIKPHIERRYSMQWSNPAARMREFVLAVRAIWDTWATGAPLAFEGEFYTHTLMAPFFDPGPNPHGNPKVMLAGVGPLMTEIAGEVADGFLCHAFSTERYIREVTVPALERGREKAGKPAGLDGFQITAPAMIVAGDTDEEIEAGIAAAKHQISFYGSTPAYRPVLELHGWGDLQDELNAMTKRGEWDKLPDLIDDDILHTFAIVGTPEEAVAEAVHRYGHVTSRITFKLPERPPADRARLFDQLRTSHRQAEGAVGGL